MISVVLDKKNIKGEIVEITDKKDINHLKNSFRMKPGDEFRVVDGEFEYICEIDSIEKKEILAIIRQKNKDNFSSSTKVDIAMGLLKNDKMELAIQKLTEIGINKIIPMITKRTIVKLKEKKDKWDTVSKEALKQCQGVKLVEIENPIRLKDISYQEYDLVIVPYECQENIKIKDVLPEGNLNSVLYLIGPEGGFSEDEIEFLKSRARIVTLGKRILRAETAAIVAGGILINEVE